MHCDKYFILGLTTRKEIKSIFWPKNITIAILPKISKSWATGHKTHWSSFKLLHPQTWPVSKTVSKRCCLSTKIWRHIICTAKQRMKTQCNLTSKFIQNIWCLIQKADLSHQKSSCAKKKVTWCWRCWYGTAPLLQTCEELF